MGMMEKVSCASCGSEWECPTGCGFMHGNLERVAVLYPEDVQKEIDNCTNGEKFPWFDFAYRLSYCRNCNTIESIPYLKTGSVHTAFAGKCAKCGQDVQLIENIENLPCPVCHKKGLSKAETGTWD